jgi:hypothetical protein
MIYGQLLKRGNIWNGIIVNNTKDGGFYWVNATIYPSKNSDGSTRYVSVKVKPTKQEIKSATTYIQY